MQIIDIGGRKIAGDALGAINGQGGANHVTDAKQTTVE